MKRRTFLLGSVSLLSSAAWAADAWPVREIKVVVPAAAGGFTDIAARLVGEQLTKVLGQPVVVEDVAGAGGLMGTQQVARAAADGYTLAMGTSNTIGTNVGIYKSLPYDPVKDFVAIASIASGPVVLTVNPSLGIKSIKELIERAKAKPGALTYGSGGIGLSSHLAGELLKQTAGIDLRHVPFKSTTPAVTAILGGHIDLLFDTLPSAMPNVASGKLTALGVTSRGRLASMPDVPPISDVLPGFEMSVWVGFFAPTGVSPDVVERLNRETNTILRNPELSARLVTMGFTPFVSTPKEFAAFVTDEIVKWKEVSTRAGITMEP